jgi:hypothetical protein
MQKVLTMVTQGAGQGALRDQAVAWDMEDGNKVKETAEKYSGRKSVLFEHKDIGLVNRGIYPTYSCPLAAIGDRWKLLAPPRDITDIFAQGQTNYDYFEWWFVKNAD